MSVGADSTGEGEQGKQVKHNQVIGQGKTYSPRFTADYHVKNTTLFGLGCRPSSVFVTTAGVLKPACNN